MKKTLFTIALVLATMLTVGCKKEKITPIAPDNSMLGILKRDYRDIIAQYPDAMDKLVEAQCTLNYTITQVPGRSELKVTEMNEVYYIGYNKGYSRLVYCNRNLETGDTAIRYTEQRSPWLGDYHIPIASLDSMISVEQAIQNVIASDLGTPATRYVSLRYPVYLFDKGHAMYIFGGPAINGCHLWVDAYSGEVYAVEDIED